MSKQIEEVMDLVREYASESEIFPTYSTLEDVELAWKAIESKLRELLPEGFVLVPVLPTETMLKAAVMNAEGDAVYKSLEERWLKEEEQKYGDVYCAMLSAAPKTPE